MALNYYATIVQFDKISNPKAPLIPTSTQIQGFPAGVVTNLKGRLDNLQLNDGGVYQIIIQAKEVSE